MAEISKSQDAEQPISPAVVGKVVQDTARTVADTAADAAVRRTAEAAQQGSRATGEALRQNAEAGADIARRGTEAGAEAMRRAGEAASETTRRGGQAVVESQRQIVAGRRRALRGGEPQGGRGHPGHEREHAPADDAAQRRRGRPAGHPAGHGRPGRGRGADQPAGRAGAVPPGQPGAHRGTAAALRARVHGHACCGTAPRWSAPCAAPPTRRCVRSRSRSRSSSASRRPTEYRARAIREKSGAAQVRLGTQRPDAAEGTRQNMERTRSPRPREKGGVSLPLQRSGAVKRRSLAGGPGVRRGEANTSAVTGYYAPIRRGSG